MEHTMAGFDGPDINSTISEISTALRALEALPEAEKQTPMVQAEIGYLTKALELRQEEEKRAGKTPTS